jgi:hypothetical protein
MMMEIVRVGSEEKYRKEPSKDRATFAGRLMSMELPAFGTLWMRLPMELSRKDGVDE